MKFDIVVGNQPHPKTLLNDIKKPPRRSYNKL